MTAASRMRPGFLAGLVVVVIVISEAPNPVGLGIDKQTDGQDEQDTTENATDDDADGAGCQIAIVVSLLNVHLHGDLLVERSGCVL